MVWFPLQGPMLRWEEFGDDQLIQMLAQMDSEVEVEVEGCNSQIYAVVCLFVLCFVLRFSF